MSVNLVQFGNLSAIRAYQPKIAPQRFASAAFEGRTNLNAPEHRDFNNAALLGDKVKGKELYLLA